MQRHANSATYVIREGGRLFPLDLVGRIEWLREMAYSTLQEEDRHFILSHVRILGETNHRKA